jgi:hypothetical protein
VTAIAKPASPLGLQPSGVRRAKALSCQIRQGKLNVYACPDDRKVYLSREEVEVYLLTPRALTDDDDEGQMCSIRCTSRIMSAEARWCDA